MNFLTICLEQKEMSFHSTGGVLRPEYIESNYVLRRLCLETRDRGKIPGTQRVLFPVFFVFRVREKKCKDKHVM